MGIYISFDRIMMNSQLFDKKILFFIYFFVADCELEVNVFLLIFNVFIIKFFLSANKYVFEKINQ
jgi:hypothetical protein